MSADQVAKTKKPKAKRAVEGESKQDRFVRLTKSRFSKFENYFDLLNNLVEGYTYTVEPQLAKEVLGKLQEKFKALEENWQTAISKAEKKLTKGDDEGPQPAGTSDNVEAETQALSS